MSHYFDAKQDEVKSNPKVVDFNFATIEFSFKTDHGTFSKDHIDSATELLLKNINPLNAKNALDLGCGYGTIGIILNKVYGLDTIMVDVNERALALAEENVKRNNASANILKSDGFNALKGQTFDLIISNPPIRIGKEKLYQLFRDAYDYLNSGGRMILVMHKKHGALSAMTYLKTRYTVSLIKKHKGFHVIECKKH